MFTNPSFETSDLTGWSALGIGSSEVLVGGPEGAYYARLKPNSGSTYKIYQSIDVTIYNELSFYARLNVSTGGGTLAINIGATSFYPTYAAENVWGKVEVDISALSGSHDVVFSAHAGNFWSEIDIDGVRLDGVGWSPTIQGTVYDKDSNLFRGVTIKAVGTTTYNTTTAINGTYSLSVNPDQYVVTASKYLYDDNAASVDARIGDKTQDFTMIPLPGVITTGRQNSEGMSILGGISSGKQHVPGLSIQGGMSLGAK